MKRQVFPLFLLCFLLLVFSGCTGRHAPDIVLRPAPYPAGTILDAADGRVVSFETMMADLQTVSIVYVGETHTQAAHHELQLKILKALYQWHPGRVAVGMEMFARPYQSVLDQWVQGSLSEASLLQKTHWYANWRYDFALYRDQLLYIQEKRIPLFALNIEFHIPSKIAAGGIDSLLPYQVEQLPDRMDLTHGPHREYVQRMYEGHAAHVKNRYDFENFYAAQVVWDEAMAEAVSRHAGDFQTMVVFTGSGHIVKGFGIPERARFRTGLSYRTVMPLAVGEPVDFSAADYIWITPPSQPHGFMTNVH